jgi:hypothetical protein
MRQGALRFEVLVESLVYVPKLPVRGLLDPCSIMVANGRDTKSTGKIKMSRSDHFAR